MAHVAFAPSAAAALDDLLASRELPANARQRLLERVSQLADFPESGRLVETGPSAGARVLTGPWWFVTAYDDEASLDTVQVVAILDGRTATARDDA